MVRLELWQIDGVTIDLEDRDAKVRAIHRIDGTEIIVSFRVTEKQMKGSPAALRQRIELLAADRILSLASFLDV
ncbi:hypothetical protein [Hyphomonas oceanitis]|uniref:Uncharacterized protein n=1 Tax=Hyphomonas oceanitis SCH89 TaxID=1280953 RepID=A0A059G8R6_9PROT|nr:hypothetical protein [Hyphomonas oceanitis]KDA03216.1 hypothetical protein HOC_06258 [Hyphomonas oceanitis SCH89]